jgi:hypothetical protein
MLLMYHPFYGIMLYMADVINPGLDNGGNVFRFPRDPRIDVGLGSAALFVDAHPEIVGFDTFERARGTIFVRSGSHDAITANSGEERRLAITGLQGNTAVAVTIEREDGMRSAYLHHMTSYNSAFGLMSLAENLQRHPWGSVAVRAVIMAEGTNRLNFDTGNLEMIPNDLRLEADVEEVIRDQFGSSAQIDTLPYYVQRENFAEYGESHNVILVELPAEGGAQILTGRVPGTPAHPSLS